MYSMVMMMAVASSGDVSSFGKKDNGCCGGEPRVGLFAKHSNGCCGGGGGLFSGLRGKHAHKKHGCCGGEVAAPAPCATPEAPCAVGPATAAPVAPATPPKTMPAPVEPKKDDKKKES